MENEAGSRARGLDEGLGIKRKRSSLLTGQFSLAIEPFTGSTLVVEDD